MPSYPLKALVLRKTKLGEADLILTLLAADGRQVRAVAKSARKTMSKLGARAEPYSVLDLLLHTGRSLEVIAEARTVASHDALRTDLDRSAAAAVVADLLDKISVEGQVEPKLFDLALATLDAFEAADAVELRLLVLAFLLKALAMHGYRPELSVCAACAGQPGERAYFSPSAGGLVCGSCDSRDPGALSVQPDTCAAMRALLRARLPEIAGLGIPEELTREMFVLTRAFVTYHVPARLKALDMFGSML